MEYKDGNMKKVSRNAIKLANVKAGNRDIKVTVDMVCCWK